MSDGKKYAFTKHLNNYIILEDIRFYGKAACSWYLPHCSIYIPLAWLLNTRKLNIYVLASSLIPFFFLIWFFLFCFWTPQFYKSSSFHIKYVENMWKCLVKYAFMCHHVSLKTFIKKTGKKIETFIKLSHSFVKHYQYYNLFPCGDSILLSMTDTFPFYSHSVVPGGLEVRSYKTRDIPGTVEILSTIWFKTYKGDKNNRISWTDTRLIVTYM